MTHLFPLDFSVFIHKGCVNVPPELSSSEVLQFLDCALNIMVIPQMEICSFQFQSLPEGPFAVVQSQELGRCIKDEAEGSQEKDIGTHVGNKGICYELRHVPRSISENSSGCLITCVPSKGSII